uniref:Uncharacterized protein n=1 Tax=Pipistrellus kuhlii TaxID=59472 RepID=A0A7J7TK10_PIPKU|nr:hypothetical protein mPipKuh1_009356 [Pipistrellus kuhlii]
MIQWNHMVASFKMAPNDRLLPDTHTFEQSSPTLYQGWFLSECSKSHFQSAVSSVLAPLTHSLIIQPAGSPWRSPCDEQRRPPTKSHVNEPSWMWFPQPREISASFMRGPGPEPSGKVIFGFLVKF